MATLITMLLSEGDALSFRLLDGQQARDVQLCIADVNCTMSVRSLVALHGVITAAMEAKREQLGAAWADEFPSTLDLGAVA